jgi:hypothetical protein
MPIAVKVKYKDLEKVFRSEDLDKAALLDINDFEQNYRDCLLFIDEINVQLAESRRSQSNKALFFSYVMQQLRHRQLDVIYTTQNDSFLETRLRYQTDLYIVCRDNAFLNGTPKKDDIGRKSRWRLHDMSGFVTGEIMHEGRSGGVPYYKQLTFWNTPFWGCYDTSLMQRYEDIPTKKYKAETPGYNLDYDRLADFQERYGVPVKLVLDIINCDFSYIGKKDLWKILNIEDNHGLKVKLGSILTELGVGTSSGTNGRVYTFPAQSMMIKKLADMGISAEGGEL